MSSTPSFEIPPDAVRVWRGFRAPALSLTDFFLKLNTVFVPASVEMQIKVGLDCYIPSVPAGLEGKPDVVPDETAILFWDSQQTYHDGFNTLAVRTYTLTHGAVYTPSSRADFPDLFAGTMAANQPYYLVPRPADWMKGQVQHLVGGRPDGQTPDQFRSELAAALSAIQAGGGLAGAIACAGDDYLVYWELANGASEGGSDTIAALAKLTGWYNVATAKPTTLDKGLWDPWPGMNIVSGDSLNMQFRRRWEK
ncbi:MAG TPA: hypothetical protein VEW94_06295 [Chloroflexia bacterium]|nr:hypothetical protein [Chloroflexia bacterium]